MKLFDILKKKKKIEKKKKKEIKEKPSRRVKLPEEAISQRKRVSGSGAIKEKIEKKSAEMPALKEKKKGIEQTYRILKTPHITEKATDLIKNNQYIFNVYEKSNKQEVKKAVESIYGVDVVSVRMINVPGKRKRLGRTLGWKKGGKKAIVRIKKGQEIEIVPR